MAVPTITTITPSSGPTAGRQLVEVVGTGFRLQPAPPALSSGPYAGPAYPTVEVLFGTTKAERVWVASSTRLFVRTPSLDAGVLGVTVRNVNETTGTPIPGESVTAAAAFTFARPKLRPDASSLNKSELQRVVEKMIMDLRRQVLGEVVLTVHTDYDEATGDGLNVTAFPKLPALGVQLRRLPPNRIYAQGGTRPEVAVGSEFNVTRPPQTVDLEFRILGVSDNPMELLGLLDATRFFFQVNKWLELDRDASDASKGTVRYELDLVGDFDLETAPNRANIGTFAGSFTIKGFDLEALAGFAQTTALERSRSLADSPSVEVGFWVPPS
jgi:hypothetical protein